MESSPNEERIPFFEGDELVYITPPEYMCRLLGHVALDE